MPLFRLGVFQQVFIAVDDFVHGTQRIGMVGNDQPVERAREAQAFPVRGGDLVTTGEAVGVCRAERDAEGAGVQ